MFSLGVLGFLAGCRSPEYRKPAERGQAERSQKDVRDAFACSLRLAPADAPADIEAKFRCDVNRPADKTLAKFADECLAEAYHHMRGEARADIGETGARGVRDAFFADYREWFDDEWEAVKAGDAPACVGRWTCAVEGWVVYCDKRYFSYRVTIDTMTGGAHPNRWIQNATYSRKTGRRLTVSDVVKKRSMTAVVNMIRKAMRAQVRENPLREQLREDIRQPYDEYVRSIRNRQRDEWGNPLVTENFLLKSDGIEWVYNQYEIACYASGIFKALVTWDALRPHLRFDILTNHHEHQPCQ